MRKDTLPIKSDLAISIKTASPDRGHPSPGSATQSSVKPRAVLLSNVQLQQTHSQKPKLYDEEENLENQTSQDHNETNELSKALSSENEIHKSPNNNGIVEDEDENEDDDDSEGIVESSKNDSNNSGNTNESFNNNEQNNHEKSNDSFVE